MAGSHEEPGSDAQPNEYNRVVEKSAFLFCWFVAKGICVSIVVVPIACRVE